jgi:hypothetical protein
MKFKFSLYDRREFFGAAAKAAAVFGITVSSRSARANPDQNSNPFAYDASRFRLTNPALIGYKEVARWRPSRRNARRIAVGADNRIYLCADNFVSVLTGEGQTLLEIALPDAARCVAADKDGTVFAATRDHVEVFDAHGARRAKWEPIGKKSWLTGLAVTENDVFAADSGARVILRYDRSGKLLREIGHKNADANVPGFVLPSPYLDVKVHPDGLLRVNNPGRHRVEAYTFEGDLEGFWGKASAAVEGFCGCCNPIAISVLPDGRIVTGEKGFPRVKVYSSSGEFESVVAGTEAFPENAKECAEPNDCTRGGLDVAVDLRGRIYIIDYVAGDLRVMERMRNG